MPCLRFPWRSGNVIRLLAVCRRQGSIMQHVRPFSPNSRENRFRIQRFRLFQDMIAQILETNPICHVLDIGGTPDYWMAFGSELDWSRLKVSVVNITMARSTRPEIVPLIGDARRMKDFKDLSFDIVHSNSVIEHVGRWDDMASMAAEIRRLAPRYFVQTPYFWFPIEPHARFPLLHWMPESWRYRILMRRSCGFWKKQPDVGSATKAIQSAVLLDKRQIEFLFPDGKIVSERFFGLTKSLIAVR
jgi:hypothetical protein